ncbi:hypothetical protein MRX96_033003 [Rhipicephalus microplus]
MPPNCRLYPMKLFSKKQGQDKNRCGRTLRQTGRQETPQHENRPRRQRATRPKISQYRKLHSLRGGSALPPHTPSPPRPPPTGNTTAGLGADRADEPEVVHQPEEQPVPLRRSTRERRPPERLRDYVQ